MSSDLCKLKDREANVACEARGETIVADEVGGMIHERGGKSGKLHYKIAHPSFPIHEADDTSTKRPSVAVNSQWKGSP